MTLRKKLVGKRGAWWLINSWKCVEASRTLDWTDPLVIWRTKRDCPNTRYCQTFHAQRCQHSVRKMASVAKIFSLVNNYRKYTGTACLQGFSEKIGGGFASNRMYGCLFATIGDQLTCLCRTCLQKYAGMIIDDAGIRRIANPRVVGDRRGQ